MFHHGGGMVQFHQKTFLNNKTRKKLYTHATLLVPKKLKYKKWQLHLIAPMFKCPPRKFGFPLLDRVILYLGWKKLHSFSSLIYLICYISGFAYISTCQYQLIWSNPYRFMIRKYWDVIISKLQCNGTLFS